ncbi:MAG: CoA transferase [Chloroflexi bacterium]|nr:CoA transferase [Chloroflexota bacterium]
MTLPLEGYRVADLGQVWAGPVLGHYLADMGAEVIRIESSAGSDKMREIAKEPSEIRKMLDANFVFRNRLSVTLNFTKARAVEMTKEIVSHCDIVIENFSPRVLAKFGLDYPALRKARPDIVMLSMSAAGQSGPFRDLMGYGPSINSVSGYDSHVGYFGDNRLMVNAWDADPTMATMGAFAVLSALHHRESTGAGQYIDLSFFEGLTSLLGESVMDYSMNRRVAVPLGNRHPMMVPHGVYPCKGKDKWLAIAVSGQNEWRAFCKAVGEQEWTEDERFADVYARLQHREELDTCVAQWTRRQERYEAMHHLQSHGVAASIVASLEDVYLDPHDQFRRQDLVIEDGRLERNDVIYGIPWHLSKTPGAIRSLAHGLGQDNKGILCGMLGMAEGEVERLMQEQVVY